MGAIIDDLDQQLASLNQLKPPGASKGKIHSITLLCVNNIQSESNIVQSLYRAVKKAPATHKLGTIYAIDSVVRRWIESAKQQGQDLTVDGRGEPGTYPAAIKRVTELMPALFDDVVKAIPGEQKEKLEGMIKIWEKGNTFPSKLLEEFRSKLAASTPANGTTANRAVSTEKFIAPVPTRPLHTPLGFPTQAPADQGHVAHNQNNSANGTPAAAPPAPAPVQDVNSILSALANAVPKPAAAQPPPPQPPAFQQNAAPQQQLFPPNLMALLGQQNGNLGMPAPPVQQPAYQQPPALPAFQGLQGFSGFPPQPPPSVPQQFAAVPPPQPPVAQSQDQLLGPLKDILPQSIINDPGKLIKALELLQDLQRDNIPVDKWFPVLQSFEAQYQAPAQPQPDYGGSRSNWNRDRSRSPDRHRRGSPVYGQYDESNRQSNGDRGGRNRFRQRSPMRDSPGPMHGGGGSMAMNGQPMQPKYIEYDHSLPRNSIKVLSRTLFVGGAVGTQQEIHDLFSRFGKVQTCIANRDKRHAFVKMTTRSHALNAKHNLERLQSGHDREVMNIARQTKWGVGFGPRECCDYAKGESIIPIAQLTEADSRWLLEAEYGGTGGQNIESGMVLEEPDIEIGAGVSSKAMSRRVTVDSSNGGSGAGNGNGNGAQGSSRRMRDDGPGGGSGGRGGRDGRRNKGHSGNGGGHQQQQYGGYQGGDTGNSSYGSGNSYGAASGGAPQMESYGYARPEPVAVATPPAVPGFGFSLPGAGQMGQR